MAWLVGLAASFAPIVTVLFGVGWLQERLGPTQWLGIGMVVVGVVIIGLRAEEWERADGRCTRGIPGGITIPPLPEGEADLGPWALEAIAALPRWTRSGGSTANAGSGGGRTAWPSAPGRAARDAFGGDRDPRARVHRPLHGVPVTERVLVELAEANLTATLGSLVLDPDGTLSAHCHAWLHPRSAWQVNLLGTAAILQAATCEASVDAIREAIGGQLADSPHPETGPRSEPDEVLTIGAFVAETGTRPPAYRPDDFAAAAGEGTNLWVRATTEGGSLTAEVPFLGGAVADGPPGPEGDLSTALLQLTSEERHPELGSGLLALLRLPLRLPAPPAARLANDLGLAEREAITVSPLLGSWCLAGDEVAFATFTPAFVLGGDSPESRRSRLISTAAWMAARSCGPRPKSSGAALRNLAVPGRARGRRLPGPASLAGGISGRGAAVRERRRRSTIAPTRRPIPRTARADAPAMGGPEVGGHGSAKKLASAAYPTTSPGPNASRTPGASTYLPVAPAWPRKPRSSTCPSSARRFSRRRIRGTPGRRDGALGLAAGAHSSATLRRPARQRRRLAGQGGEAAVRAGARAAGPGRGREASPGSHPRHREPSSRPPARRRR